MQTRSRAQQVGGPARLVVLAWVGLLVLVTVTLVFAVMRARIDWPHLVAGTLPEPDSFEYRYVVNAVVGHGHILTGCVFLLCAPFQLSRRFRTRHYPVHRLMGRVAVGAGVTTGVLAVAVGVAFPFGGVGESAAAVVFGCWFVAALVTAFLAIRRRDVVRHRRWMIRAVAAGLAVGSIRVWVGLLTLAGVPLEDTFDPAFWIAFVTHVAAAEVYLALRPAVRRPG